MDQYGFQIAAIGAVKLLGIYSTESSIVTSVYIEHSDFLYRPLTAIELEAFGEVCIKLAQAIKLEVLKR